VPAIGDALAVAASGVRPFAIALADAGTFGRPASPRVLWLGIDGDVTSFTALQAAIAGALAGLGFAPEDRAFHPHITLARARDPRGDRDLARARAALDRPDAPSITVDDVVLFESRLAPSGARYTPLLRAALAGVPPTR
jgi:2'-5' RNA ligase